MVKGSMASLMSWRERLGRQSFSAIPTHVRHLQRGIDLKANHLTGQHAQAAVRAPFVPRLKQQLQPQANSQKRSPRLQEVQNRLLQITLANLADRFAES